MPSLKKSERQPTFIYEMMQRLGIEPGEVMLPRLGLVYMTAFHRCQSCQVKEACRKWLDSMPCSVANAPNFCPCEDILFELAASRRVRRRTC
jgi:hypothetical protein